MAFIQDPANRKMCGNLENMGNLENGASVHLFKCVKKPNVRLIELELNTP